MIKLSSEKHLIRKMQVSDFWKKLDDITVGQKLNPELAYSMPFWGNFDNVFAGRKTSNRFSIYLYRPLFSGFRIEILAKGVVTQHNENINIDVSYEIPFWSIIMFVLLGSLIEFLIWFENDRGIATILSVLIFLAYVILLKSNYQDVKKEVNKQFLRFQGYNV